MLFSSPFAGARRAKALLTALLAALGTACATVEGQQT
jgi:hypothetical protein